MNPIHYVAIDPERPSSRRRCGTARPTSPGVSSSGVPPVALIEVDAARVVPPHCSGSVLRLPTVRSSGEPSRGVGGGIDVSPILDIPERMK